MKEKKLVLLNEDYLMSKIYTIRGVQVMLDVDLAAIYGYSTTRFNEQVKNNIERFDDDFRFQLTEIEFKSLMSKFSTSNRGDYATKDEMIFHCGGSSKDGGKRVTSISRVEDTMLYQDIISNLQNNSLLQL